MELVLSYTASTSESAAKLATVLGVHQARREPATIFVAGRVAEKERELLLPAVEETGDLVDVNTCTYRHIRVLRKVPWSMPQPSDQLIAEEITSGARAVRSVLGRPCRGVRPAEGAGAGFRGWASNLSAMREAGLTWSSTYLRSTYGDTAPGDLCGPFRYDADGYSDLLELPSHGWMDSAIKEYEGADTCDQQRIVRWPSPFAYPDELVKTPEEEFAVHQRTLNVAEAACLPYCCLAFDVDSTVRPQDPEARIISLLIDHAAEKGMPLTTLDELAERFEGMDPTTFDGPPIPSSRGDEFDPGTLFA